MKIHLIVRMDKMDFLNTCFFDNLNFWFGISVLNFTYTPHNKEALLSFIQENTSTW